MSTQTLNVANSNTNTAAFVAWGQGISNALSALGLVKTSDTGQINWATASAPGAAATKVGYEVWKFNDTLQSTAPVFLKIYYGSGNTSSLNPGLWITVGQATDGAGNLSFTGPGEQNLIQTSNSTTASACYLSGGNNRLSLCLWPSAGSTGIFFCVERIKDSGGDDTTSGIFVAYVYYGGSVQKKSYVIPAVGGASTVSETSLISAVSTSGSMIRGSTVNVSPVYPMLGGQQPPCLSCCLFLSGDMPDLNTFAVSFYGTTHTYLGFKTTNLTAMDPASTSSARLAMLWE